MEQRAADIRAGTAPECIWLLEHPPLYTAGTSADPSELLDSQRFPVYQTGRGGRYTYHGPGQRVAYVMLDLKNRGADVRCFVHDLEEWVIRTLAQFTIKGERRDGRVGIWVRRGAPNNPASREDKNRRDRCAHSPLGQLSRHRHQRRARPRTFCRHRALRDQRARYHVNLGSGHHRHHAGSRQCT